MCKKPVAAGKSSFDLIDATELFSRIPLTPGIEVLDVACGAGRYSMEMAKLLDQRGMVHAVDMWDEGIELLKESVRQQGIRNIKPVRADITKRLPLDDGSIDLCLMATILHDLPPAGQDAALEEMGRILRPSGTLAVIEFKKIDRGPGPPVAIRMSATEVEEKICAQGFRKTYGGDVGEFNYLLLFEKTV
jgi:ubiquinone/menaquinone biosynthesis C-methylase UbiE